MSLPLIVYLGAPEGYEALCEVVGKRAETRRLEAEPEPVREALREAAALLDASMRVRIDDEMVAAAANLSIISCATTGSDHITRTELERRKIPVRTLREDPEVLREVNPAAELSWTLVLACARQLPAAIAHVRAGRWEREEFPGVLLNGRVLGLVGCGRLGQWMARYGAAFGMSVLGCDPHVDPWPEDIERVGLGELFARADVVSVHVHLNEETRGLVSADLLAAAKPGLILVNTSRGAVVDEAALLAGLNDGRIGAAGVDVVDGEPDIDGHPLVAYARANDNLIITPHIGGFSPDAVRRVCTRAAEKIVEHLGL